jgi:hypothetical protein
VQASSGNRTKPDHSAFATVEQDFAIDGGRAEGHWAADRNPSTRAICFSLAAIINAASPGDCGKPPRQSFGHHNHAIEFDIVAQILDQMTRMRHCRAIASKADAYVFHAQTQGYMGNIHGKLPDSRDFQTWPRWPDLAQFPARYSKSAAVMSIRLSHKAMARSARTLRRSRS